MNFWIFWFITGLFKECCKQKSRAESSVLLWFFSSGLTKREMPSALSFIMFSSPIKPQPPTQEDLSWGPAGWQRCHQEQRSRSSDHIAVLL